MYRRREWYDWPRRRWVKSHFDGETVEYHLECGHVLHRRIHPPHGFSMGWSDETGYLSRFPCGDCFHDFPKGHRTPMDHRCRWYDDKTPLQLELPL